MPWWIRALFAVLFGLFVISPHMVAVFDTDTAKLGVPLLAAGMISYLCQRGEKLSDASSKCWDLFPADTTVKLYVDDHPEERNELISSLMPNPWNTYMIEKYRASGFRDLRVSHPRLFSLAEWWTRGKTVNQFELNLLTDFCTNTSGMPWEWCMVTGNEMVAAEAYGSLVSTRTLVPYFIHYGEEIAVRVPMMWMTQSFKTLEQEPGFGSFISYTWFWLLGAIAVIRWKLFVSVMSFPEGLVLFDWVRIFGW